MRIKRRSDEQFNAELKKARVRVMRMDAIDGFADRHGKTILAALKAGIQSPNEECLFEAYAMLEELVLPKKNN